MNENLLLYLDVQKMVESETIPEQSLIEQWVKTSLQFESRNSHRPLADEYEVTVRIVDREEIRKLNSTYRHRDKATNVLSFPFEAPPEVQLPLLGDLVICHDVVLEEAQQQGKSVMAHWAHMIVHGILHLMGYDHIDDAEAEVMEALEIGILEQLGVANPYE